MNTDFRKYRYPLLAFAFMLLAGGFYAYRNLKTGLFPDITFPKIKVIADAGQQPVDKMMTTVTIPLENIIRRTEGLQYIRSTTSRGSSEISVFLEWDTDINTAKSQIESFINQSKNSILPNTVTSVEKMNPSILPVMGYSLEGDLSQVDLKKIARFQVKPYLAATPGVADIAVIGGKEKELQIVLKPYVIETLGISIETIKNAVVGSNILLSNGYATDNNRMYLTLTDNAINGLEDLENLVIDNTQNRLLQLKDIADIQVSEAREYIKIWANGQNVPLIAVIKQPDANLIEVNENIERKVAELAGILPPDVHLVPYYKQADFVNSSIASIKHVLWIGLLLALMVVVFFLRSFSASMVVLIAIPISLCLTLIMLLTLGYTFNIMTLGAIAAAIGLMIDDVVIVIEQIHKSREEHPEKAIYWCTHKAVDHLLPAMLGSSLSTLVIFIPFILMTGVAGAYFKVMAFSMIIALACSFLVTWLIAPVLYMLFARSRPIQKKSRSNTAWIRYILKRPAIGILFAIACVMILWLLPSRLASGFLPEMDEGSIVLDFYSPPGTTLEETDRMLTIVNGILDTVPEVEAYSLRLGTQMGFFITEPNRGDYLIKLKDHRNTTTEEVSDVIRKQVEAAVPPLTVDFGQVIGDMLGDLMSSVQPIEIKVFGENNVRLQELARQIAAIVEQVEGTADVNDGIIVAGPEIIVHPKAREIAQLGLNPAIFQEQLEIQLQGTVISSMIDREQLIDIRLIYPGARAKTVEDIKKSTLMLPGGAMVPLGNIASVTVEPGVAEINRENQKSMAVVTARLNNRDLGSTLSEIRSKLSQTLSMPPGYRLEYGGEYKEQQQAFKELLTILVAASLLVFTVILFLFRKIKIALVIIFVAILGVAGCLLSLYLTGIALNVGSYTGIIMIVGIIGENCIFTYRQFQEMEEVQSLREKLEYAIAARLRPKLMTAFAAIMALIPLALGFGAGAQLHQPLAIAVIGGLVFALPLLLVVLPILIYKLKV